APPPAPPGPNFVTSEILGTARNNADVWVGMQITVGPNNLVVSALGRWVRAGNSGTHAVRITTSDHIEIASVNVPTSGATANAFAFVDLPSPVTLIGNLSYSITSREFNTGDSFYDDDT